MQPFKNNTGPQQNIFVGAVDSSMIFLCIFSRWNRIRTRWTPTRQDFDITSKNIKKFTGSNEIINFMLLSTPFLRISNFVAP